MGHPEAFSESRTYIMKNKKLNTTQIWKQFEDIVVPRLRLNIVDRAVYSHLLRHSRLEGKVRLQFSIPWLARAARLTSKPVRFSVRRLVEHGALRLVERSKVGHLVDVRLPDEIRALRNPAPRPRRAGENGFSENEGTAPGHPRPRARPVLLLSAAAQPPCALPGPRGAPCPMGARFLPEPGLLLPGMQLRKGAEKCAGFSALAVPRAALDGRRAQRPAPRARRLGLR